MKSQTVTLNLLTFKSQNKDKRSDADKDSFEKVFNEIKNNVNMNRNIKDNNSNQKAEHITQTYTKGKENNEVNKLNGNDDGNKIDKDKQIEIQKDISDDNKNNKYIQNYDAIIELLNLLNAFNLNSLNDINLNDIDLNSLNQFEKSIKDLSENLKNLKLNIALAQKDIADFKGQDILKIENEIIDTSDIKEILVDFSKLFDLKNLQEKIEIKDVINVLSKSIKDSTSNFNESLTNNINIDTKNVNINNKDALSQLITEIQKLTQKVKDILKDIKGITNISQDTQKIDTTIDSAISNTANILLNIENTDSSQFSSQNNDISDESQRKDSNKGINSQSNFSNIIQIGNKINFQTLKETQISQVQKAEIIQKVVDSIKVAIQKDMANVSISLKPESLGKIVIELTKDANGLIKGNIIVQTNEVKEVVSSSLNNLVSMLKDQGINISGLNVGLNHQSQNQNSFMQKRYKPSKQIETSQVKIDSIFYGIEEGYFSMKA